MNRLRNLCTHFLGAFLISTPLLANACGIIYGKDWALMLEPPAHWEAACGNKAMEGTVITLWPSESGPKEAKSLMYVTVSLKEPTPLNAFAEDEQARYLRTAKNVSAKPLRLPSNLLKVNAFAFELSPDAPARQEYIAYIEGPTAYFILVLSSSDANELGRQRQNFFAAIEHFVPMKRE